MSSSAKRSRAIRPAPVCTNCSITFGSLSKSLARQAGLVVDGQLLRDAPCGCTAIINTVPIARKLPGLAYPDSAIRDAIASSWGDAFLHQRLVDQRVVQDLPEIVLRVVDRELLGVEDARLETCAEQPAVNLRVGQLAVAGHEVDPLVKG